MSLWHLSVLKQISSKYFCQLFHNMPLPRESLGFILGGLYAPGKRKLDP